MPTCRAAEGYGGFAQYVAQEYFLCAGFPERFANMFGLEGVKSEQSYFGGCYIFELRVLDVGAPDSAHVQLICGNL